VSISGIFSSSLFDFNAQSIQNKRQQFQQEFQQLGQDLQSGNLSAAQTDFATLQQSAPQAGATSPSQSLSQISSPIAQAFNQLSKNLQSGNVSAAQQDFATIQQNFQNHAVHVHHHHQGGGGGSSAVSQLLEQLGQNLQSGDLSFAQQAYNALQLDFQPLAQNNGLPTPVSMQSSSNGLSIDV
jgi:outer membrane protein assembly factor BamD (BamD/ComL family)